MLVTGKRSFSINVAILDQGDFAWLKDEEIKFYLNIMAALWLDGIIANIRGELIFWKIHLKWNA